MNNNELQAETEAQQSKTAEILPSAPLVANPMLADAFSINDFTKSEFIKVEELVLNFKTIQELLDYAYIKKNELDFIYFDFKILPKGAEYKYDLDTSIVRYLNFELINKKGFEYTTSATPLSGSTRVNRNWHKLKWRGFSRWIYKLKGKIIYYTNSSCLTDTPPHLVGLCHNEFSEIEFDEFLKVDY